MPYNEIDHNTTYITFGGYDHNIVKNSDEITYIPSAKKDVWSINIKNLIIGKQNKNNLNMIAKLNPIDYSISYPKTCNITNIM